ncbi:MAG: hypothetical protein ACK4SR_09550 [Thiobacillus sp.]
MKREIGKVLMGLFLSFGLSACGQSSQESPSSEQIASGVTVAKPTATHDAVSDVMKRDGADVRRFFIGSPKPLLDKEHSISVLASSQGKMKPKILVKEVDYPKALAFSKDGVLYFIGDHEDAIVAVYPDGSSKVIARSGVMGYATPDGKGQREPLSNTFEGLSIAPDGRLLTLRNGAYPYAVNITTGEAKFLDFILPSGQVVKTERDFSYPAFRDYQNWELRLFEANSLGHFFVFNAITQTWYRYVAHGALEVVGNPYELPPRAFMVHSLGGVLGTLASDGYIYAVEEGQKPDAPDRVIRIGDPGQSSLRKDASRVTIAKFKHGELTGALAFSPKGELAVGAQNAIYLITPGPAKKPQPEKAP